MNKRKLRKALEPTNVADLRDAEMFAAKRGKPLTMTIAVHPKLLETYPADISRWVSWLTNKIRIYSQRAGFGYYAIWVRENYEGDRREHLHMLVHVPEREREDFESALRRWLPGAQSAVAVGRPRFKALRSGGRVNEALTYMLKQMTPQAWFSLSKSVRRETHCRDLKSPVAPVLGQRSGVSRSLNSSTRQAFWSSPREVAKPLPEALQASA